MSRGWRAAWVGLWLGVSLVACDSGAGGGGGAAGDTAAAGGGGDSVGPAAGADVPDGGVADGAGGSGDGAGGDAGGACGSCPSGTVCASGAGGWACVVVTDLACAPCDAPSDCAALDAACAADGDGGRCALPCGVEDACPAGLVCRDLQTTDDAPGRGCLPPSGTCSCTEATAGATRPCTRESAGGSCPGVETCSPGVGWTCDAPAPAPETCNGADDDCDGQTDEELAPHACKHVDELGSCPGTEACVDGAWVCDAQAPAAELCNGVDDDCDGLTDEGFPALGKPCDGPDPDACVSGTWACALDGGLECEGDTPSAELCNGVDDDCDGQIDEDYGSVGAACDGEDADHCAGGVVACLPGGLAAACMGDIAHVETCDGTDDDCDGATDEGFADPDGDGIASCVDTDDDGDGDPDATDCAPDDPALHHGAVEACDGEDADCDGFADDGFTDTDGDGVADCVDGDDDDDGVADGNDRCPLVPDPEQTDTDGDGDGDACDADDDDDGLEDGADNCPLLASLDTTDTDGDGAGDPCDADDDGDGAPDLSDCKPKDPTVSPGLPELCNGLDDDCDKAIDEGFADTDADGAADCIDGDDDGDGDPDEGDCAPLDAARHHAAAELCNGVDDDCDGLVDDGWPDVDGDGVADCVDADADGDGDPDATDCAPLDPKIHHNAAEVCNGKDEDCDAVADDGFPDPDGDGLASCVDPDDDGDAIPDVFDDCPEVPNEGQQDLDGDGVGDACDDDVDGDGEANATDCQPQNASVKHGATELCNGFDDDCDGSVDEEDAIGCSALAYDGDDDGWGVAASTKCLCGPAGKYVAAQTGDCDDGAALVFPGAPEVCNGVDDDCDGATDEAGATGCKPRWSDVDGDGWGAGVSTCLCGATGTFTATKAGDCNDGAGAVHPLAPELCNGTDDDCDGKVDEAGAGGCFTLYADADNDGWGATGDAACLCKPLGVYKATAAGDCDDGDKAVSPAAQEACNGADDDCDGAVDEAGAAGCAAWYRDLDDDGWGHTSAAKCLCGPVGDYTATAGGDCNDLAPTVYPGAGEVCNGADDDCDGAVDEKGALGCSVWYVDGDQDGFGLPGSAVCLCGATGKTTATVGGDCNDAVKSIHPTATEVCNLADDDCDGIVDEEAAASCAPFYRDVDGDGFGLTADSKCLCGAEGEYSALEGGDCDEGSVAVNPAADEECNGVDDDCDGATDEQDAVGCVDWYRDDDKDGFGKIGDVRCLCAKAGAYTAAAGTDCDDGVKAVNPGALEACNGADDDCDLEIDEEDAAGCSLWYADGDEDGFGVTGDARCLCAAEGAHTSKKPGDCDDAAAAVHPGGQEVCGGADEDCDGSVDEEGAQGCTVHYKDLDEDGWGVTVDTRCLCGPFQEWTAAKGGDCADDDGLVNPGAVEACNGHDDDCDLAVDELGADGCAEWYEDVDGDDYGKTAVKQCACGAMGAFTATVGGDCDDDLSGVNPGAPEVCGGGDDDCDGLTDEADATGCTVLFEDKDVDGWGLAGSSACLCAPVTPFVAAVEGDCDDDVGAVFPGAEEVCNGTDDDCDGEVDEGPATGCTLWFVDGDLDTWGLDGSEVCLCAADGGHTADRGGDCQDGVSGVNPGVEEICGNGVDDDCDPATPTTCDL